MNQVTHLIAHIQLGICRCGQEHGTRPGQILGDHFGIDTRVIADRSVIRLKLGRPLALQRGESRHPYFQTLVGPGGCGLF